MIDFFPSNLPGSLSNEVILSYDGVIGCPEKTDIARQIKKANCYRLSSDIVGAVGWLGESKAEFPLIMANSYSLLEAIVNSNFPVWIEFDYDDRFMYSWQSYDGQDRSIFEKSRMGYLFIPEVGEEGQSIVSVLLIWKQGDRLYSNPGVLHFDCEHFIKMEEGLAPSYLDILLGYGYNRSALKLLKEDVFESLISPCYVRIMEGMVEDTRIIHSGTPEAIQEYLQSSRYMLIAEIPFLFFSLMFLTANPKENITCPGKMITTNGMSWKNGKKPMGKSIYGVLSVDITGQVFK